MKKIEKHGLKWIIDDDLPKAEFYLFSWDDIKLNPRTGVFELKNKNRFINK